MTETSNDVQRQQTIVKILIFLHEGGDFAKAKQMFAEAFDNVDVAEITAAERQLIANGLDPAEIQHLCNVHAALFEGAIVSGEANADFEVPGHPVKTFKLENLVLNSLIKDELLPCLKKWQQAGQDDDYLARMTTALNDLATIDLHYARKENLLFPLMEKYGITAPPKVMWGVDDQIRQLIKQAQTAVTSRPLPDKYQVEAAVEKACQEVVAMIFKEEAIMLPMIAEVATPADWGLVRQGETEFGYTLINEPLPWQPAAGSVVTPAPAQTEIAQTLNQLAQELAKTDPQAQAAPAPVSPAAKPTAAGRVMIGPGQLSLAQLTAIFQVLPVDLTLVDHTDHVQWFSDSSHRIFPRPASVIGRAVVNCHPPKSIAKVQAILEDFHSGRRDRAEFWFQLHEERFIHIDYFALRDEAGTYLGCLEASQDLTKLRALDGEQRL